MLERAKQFNIELCASGSAVEHLLAKEGVAGSIPVSRSEKAVIPNGIAAFFESNPGLEDSMSRALLFDTDKGILKNF